MDLLCCLGEVCILGSRYVCTNRLVLLLILLLSIFQVQHALLVELGDPLLVSSGSLHERLYAPHFLLSPDFSYLLRYLDVPAGGSMGQVSLTLDLGLAHEAGLLESLLNLGQLVLRLVSQRLHRDRSIRRLGVKGFH